MNNVTESNPERFFENIPEIEEAATFMFDDASLRAARCIQKKKKTQKNLNKCINKCKKNYSDYGWD